MINMSPALHSSPCFEGLATDILIDKMTGRCAISAGTVAVLVIGLSVQPCRVEGIAREMRRKDKQQKESGEGDVRNEQKRKQNG